MDDIVDKTNGIFKYIRTHQYLMVAFFIYLPNLGLMMPGSTRFVTNYLVFDQLIKVKNASEQIIIHHDWTIYVNKLNEGRDDQMRCGIKTRQIKKNVNNDNFWASCDNFRHMLEKVLKASRVFDIMYDVSIQNTSDTNSIQESNLGGPDQLNTLVYQGGFWASSIAQIQAKETRWACIISFEAFIGPGIHVSNSNANLRLT